MAFTFNGVTPTKIIYNGTELTELIYNGVVVWQLAISETLSVTFPAVSGTSTSYTVSGSTYTHALSKTASYSGYDAYSTCVIDGVTVGTTWTIISQTTALLGGAKYDAYFANGVLTVRTTATKTGLSSTPVSVSAALYNTTATFSNGSTATQIVAQTGGSIQTSDGDTFYINPVSIDVLNGNSSDGFTFGFESGRETSAFYSWGGNVQQTGYSSIYDYDDLFAYDGAILTVYDASYELASSGVADNESYFTSNGIEPIITLRLVTGGTPANAVWEEVL